SQVGGGLVEILAVPVEPAGHLPHPQANGRLRRVHPTIQRRGRALAGRIPASPPQTKPTVHGQHGVILTPLIAFAPLRLGILRRGEKRLPPHPLPSAWLARR